MRFVAPSTCHTPVEGARETGTSSMNTGGFGFGSDPHDRRDFPGRQGLFTFNGRSSDATVIDAKAAQAGVRFRPALRSTSS